MPQRPHLKPRFPVEPELQAATPRPDVWHFHPPEHRAFQLPLFTTYVAVRGVIAEAEEWRADEGYDYRTVFHFTLAGRDVRHEERGGFDPLHGGPHPLYKNRDAYPAGTELTLLVHPEFPNVPSGIPDGKIDLISYNRCLPRMERPLADVVALLEREGPGDFRQSLEQNVIDFFYKRWQADDFATVAKIVTAATGKPCSAVRDTTRDALRALCAGDWSTATMKTALRHVGVALPGTLLIVDAARVSTPVAPPKP